MWISTQCIRLVDIAVAQGRGLQLVKYDAFVEDASGK